MTTIEIEADDTLVQALAQIAERQQLRLEEVTRRALQAFVHEQREVPTPQKRYSFIGIAHSGTPDLSQRVETSLQDADRREGWSLPE